MKRSISNMPPVTATSDCLDDVCANVQTFSDHSRGSLGGLDLFCKVVGDSRIWVSFAAQTIAERMEIVFLAREILQIQRPVIASNKVNMVRLFTFRAWADESRRDDAMNRFGGMDLPHRKNNLVVAAPSGSHFQKPKRCGTLFLVMVESANSPKIRNLIESLKPHDITPFFRSKFFGGKLWLDHIRISFNRAFGSVAGLVGLQPAGPSL